MIEENGATAVAAGEKPFPQIGRVVLLLVAAFVLLVNLSRPLYVLTHASIGSIGYSPAEVCGADRFCGVSAIKPGGPMGRLGVRVGDEVRFDRPMDYFRPFAIGESRGFVLRRAGAKSEVSRHVVTGETYRRPATAAAQLIAVFPSVATVLVGALLVLSSRRRVAATLLGGALICMGLIGTYPPPWCSAAPIYVITTIALGCVYSAPVPLLVAFARAFRREMGGRDPAPWRTVMWGYVALIAAIRIYRIWIILAGRSLPGLGDLFEVSVGLVYAGMILAALILAIGWRESQGVARTRHGFMLVALLLISGQQFFGLAINLTSNDFTFANPQYWAFLITPLFGVVVFAYALLRHRVVDLGFVVNRTLIYGVLSTLILLTFGLAEWAIEKVLPFSHETSAIIEASVALGVFLVFHRVRDAIETVVEKLLFVQWHRNEARLRAFVAEANFIRKTAVLTQAFVEELARFSGGADCRLFTAGDAQDFVQVTGAEAVVMDGDDPLVVKLRATREVVETDRLLVLPMIHRAELTGFAVLGLKPSGDAYRPDERTVLAWAAHQIGLDLHALEVERLEQEASDLRRTIADQAAQIQLARDLGALRPA